MIQLNTDFTLLNKFFGITPSKIQKYANMDFEEIMKVEAEQGNEKAAKYKEILSDPDKLLEIFKLADPQNKFIILQNMSEQDVDKLLPFLTNEQLSMGLQFFNDEKLISMCTALPIEELIGMVFEKFDLQDVLKLMEDSAMDVFLAQPNVQRSYSEKYFEGLEQATLENIMVNSTGDSARSKSKQEYLDEIKQMDENDYSKFLTNLERKHKIEMIDKVVEQDENLLTLFKPDDIVAPMTLIMKQEKIKMLKNLDKEFLTPMIQELPMDLTQVVLTQIDPNDFAEILAEDFQDILGQVVLFSTRGV